MAASIPLAEPNPSPPADPHGLRRFRAGYWFGAFNGLTWMVGLGTPMILFVEHLGGSAFQVGLASSFLVLLFPVQVVATALLPRLGFRRQMVTAWSARATFLLVPFAIATFSSQEPAPWMATALVASVFGFCFFRAIGVAAHISWFAAILPDEARGRFFATDNAVTAVVGIATLLSCAFVFENLPPLDAFRAVYAVAVFGSAAAVWNLLRLPRGPEAPPSPLNRMLGEVARLALRPGLFRQYLSLSLLWLFSSVSIPAFAAYYLKVETGAASSLVLSFTAAQFVGQLAGTFVIRHWIDRISIRRFFQTASTFVILVSSVWLGLLADVSSTDTLLWVAYVLFGAAQGISTAAHFTYLPELAPPERRPITIAIFGAIAGVVAGLAPIVWGLVLQADAGTPGIDPTTFRSFFIVTISMSLVAIALLERLPDRARFPRGT